MTIDRAFLVRVPGDEEVLWLVRDIRTAAARARRMPPGERGDIVRFEALSSQLERIAGILAGQGADVVEVPVASARQWSFIDEQGLEEEEPRPAALVREWIAAGDIAVEVRAALSVGDVRRREFGSPPQPEQRWEAKTARSPKAAIAERFAEQIAATLTPGDPPAFIEPSGVSNSVLTNTLREYVSKNGGRVDAPVRYQDGSLAEPFPLRSLRLRRGVPDFPRELRVAMLSIRHVEMDVEVDGCWLRNFDISRPRPAAETDQLAFEISRRQLASLCRGQPLLLRLYQTGLDAAVVGIYRAVVHQLLDAPGSVGVIPMFYRHPPSGSQPGKDVVTRASYFAEGPLWAT